MISLLQQTTVTVVEIEAHATVAGAGAQDGAAAIAGHGEGATPAADALAHAAEAAGAHGAAGAGDAAEAVHATGMPQLNPEYFGNLIFWLLVTLGVLFWVLSRVALPRIGSIISDRQGVITGDLMQAEEFKKKAKDAEAAYDQALADARGEANKIIAAQKAEIHKELDNAIAKADADIAARTVESEKRLGAIRESAASDARNVARDVTAELIRAFGGNADDTAINSAIDARLKGAS
ncbi:MAG: F0F1 ATP synthase subunit B' [Paracoccus sp. (in: a-proteobacteria)]